MSVSFYNNTQVFAGFHNQNLHQSGRRHSNAISEHDSNSNNVSAKFA